MEMLLDSNFNKLSLELAAQMIINGERKLISKLEGAMLAEVSAIFNWLAELPEGYDQVLAWEILCKHK